MVACTGLFARHGSDSTCHTLLDAGGKHGLSYHLSSFFCPCTGVQVLCWTFLRLQQKGLNFRSSRGDIPRDSLERRGGSKKPHLGIPELGMTTIQLSLDHYFEVFNGLHQAVYKVGTLFPIWPSVFDLLSFPVTFRY